MDLTSVIGVIVAVGAIVAGQVLEGGHLSSLLQPTAAMIVLGGTLGAVAVQFPTATLKRTWTDLRMVFAPRPPDLGAIVARMVAMATRARREGLITLESEADELPDPFMRRGFAMAIDGVDPKLLRETLELDLMRREEEGEGSAKVLEAAGGYAPTVGILGAVLGLIHVMENLSDPSKLGAGIAVAFVATVYGVASANLLFLPMAGKLKARHREQVIGLEVITEGICAIASGEAPRAIERKLEIYVEKREAGATPDTAAAAAAELSGL
jgi:chemotaxis protein MotA